MKKREDVMAEVRTLLQQAHEAEINQDKETADAFCAQAANKMARVCFLSSKVVPIRVNSRG